MYTSIIDKKTKHSTSIEAVKITKKVNVGQLVIEHYSGTYANFSLK
jgi:ribonuclease BN (tRNA processing enzyme)